MEEGTPMIAAGASSGSCSAVLLSVKVVAAQGNYEIQGYGTKTVPPKTLMTELHSNYTIEGQKNYIDGVIPTNHQERDA